MGIDVRPNELIMGNYAKNFPGVPFFPKYVVDWILKDMDAFAKTKGDRLKITEEQK